MREPTQNVIDNERDEFADAIKKADITSMSRLNVYRNIPFNYNLSTYVNIVHDRKLRGLMARMRTGTFPIQIEMGRYRDKKQDERLCLHCLETEKKKEIENEVHFLHKCPKYKEERLKYLTTIDATQSLPANDQDIIKMYLCNSNHYITCKYLQTCLKKRNIR